MLIYVNMNNLKIAYYLNFIPLGIGYLLIGLYLEFIVSAFYSILAFFSGYFLGPILFDWVLMSQFGECGYGFSKWCDGQRPFWAILLIILVWLIPLVFVSLVNVISIKKHFEKTSTN